MPFLLLLYTITAEVLASFIDANKKIIGILIGDHENKIVNSADETIIFLRGIITCLNRIQAILSLYEDASSPRINFQKVKPYGLAHMKMELINQNK